MSCVEYAFRCGSRVVGCGEIAGRFHRTFRRESTSMSTLLSADEQGWLLSELANLIIEGGSGSFLEATLLEPNERHFPDPFTPDVSGVLTLVRRLLAYSSLRDLRVSVETYRNPEEVVSLGPFGFPETWRHSGAAAWFAGVDAGECLFGVDVNNLQDPEGLAGV